MDKKTMRGLMIYGKGDYRYETNIPIPQVGPDDILIKSEGSGVCASDVKCWHGASSYWKKQVPPATQLRPPRLASRPSPLRQRGRNSPS